MSCRGAARRHSRAPPRRRGQHDDDLLDPQAIARPASEPGTPAILPTCRSATARLGATARAGDVRRSDLRREAVDVSEPALASEGKHEPLTDMVSSVDLGPERVAALSREIDAASALMRHGFAILDDYRFASRDAEPLFACLAGGTEKLLKLTFGLVTLDDGGSWPTKATMQNAGHKIVELDATVRGLLVKRQRRSTAPGLIARLLEMVDGHPGVVLTLATLERYAVNGRFYNLDLLGGRARHLLRSCGSILSWTSSRPTPRCWRRLPTGSTSGFGRT
jgi:hypothetical protein